MSTTQIGTLSPLAIKKQSAALAVLSLKDSFWGKGFIGSGPMSKAFIQRINDLKSEAGDEVAIDLLMPGKAAPIIGDDVLDGNEEKMVYYTDKVKIDDVRHGVSKGTRMSRKRTVHDLRKNALRVEADWWKRCFDEALFIAATGTQGTASGFIWDINSKFWQTNPLTAPDSVHQFYGGAAISAATLTAGDTMTLTKVENIAALAETMGGDATDELSMVPGSIGGEDAYCMVMHTYQAVSLKRSTATGEWLDIQKAATTHEGRENPIFKGRSSMGVYGGVVLKSHRNVITNNAGAGGAVKAAHALFLGRQGVLFASGQQGDDMSFRITEEVKDHQKALAHGSSCIFGVRKSRYETASGFRDFGVMNVLTANPVPV